MKKKNVEIRMTATTYECPECGGTTCDRVAGPNEPGWLVCAICLNDEILDSENTGGEIDEDEE